MREGKLTSKEFLERGWALAVRRGASHGSHGEACIAPHSYMDVMQRITVTGELLEEFRMLGERFPREKPREVPMLVDTPSVLVFTDGASEAECHTVGGVLVFPDGREPRFFGAYVPGALTHKWFSSMKHIIGPVEAYALLLARAVWHQTSGWATVYLFL